MTREIITIISIVLGLLVIIALVFIPMMQTHPSKRGTRSACGAHKNSQGSKKTEGFAYGKDFYLYNYYKVPVDVKVVPPGKTEETLVASQISPGGRSGVRWGPISEILQNGAIVRSYIRQPVVMIGESSLNIPEGTTIKALHLGMSSGHEDLSMAGEFTKSTLGTALPRLRIINASPRNVTLRAGSDSIRIPARSSYMYYGENNMGIHLGTILRDQEGIFSDYTIDKPMTDLHLGIISDAQTPLYAGSKIGGDFDDTVEVANYPLELHGMGGPHNGASRDRTYIP